MSSSLWRTAAQLSAQDRPFALATVSRQRGSLPMASDAKLLVAPDGFRAGTVGGGCVEADVMAQALTTLQTGQPAIVSHTLNADVAGDIGLSCGGTVDLFLEPLVPSPAVSELCGTVASAIDSRLKVAVCTALHAGPEGASKMAYCGGHSVAAGSAGEFPRPEDIWAVSGVNAFVIPEDNIFVERVPRPPRVLIFGAGHVGREIARLAAASGFHVFVTDDREDFANPDRVPEAHQVVADDFNRVLDGLVLDADDYVLATTRGHAFDATIIERTANSAAGYVGMLGSRRKKSVIFKALLQAGVPQNALERVHCPIGLDIGADNPAEIAVSVVAELIRARRLSQPAQVTP